MPALTTAERIRRPAARAEAWKRRALRMQDDRDALGFQLAAEPQDLGPCPTCEDLRAEIRELNREIQHATHDSYGEGYWKGREEERGGDY